MLLNLVEILLCASLTTETLASTSIERNRLHIVSSGNNLGRREIAASKSGNAEPVSITYVYSLYSIMVEYLIIGLIDR